MSAQAMPDPAASPEANPLPTSAHIIGFLVKTLEVDLGLDITERTWRNYTAGKPVNDKTREAIFDALARALLGPTSNLSLPQGQVVSAEDVVRGIREVLMAQASHWDDIRARLPLGAAPKAVPLLTLVALRLGIIDLALRLAVMLVRQKEIPPPQESEAPQESDSPPALEENVLGRLLRELLKIARLTREVLAEELGVSKQAVDKWLDGRDLPPAERLEEIIDLVVKRTGTTKDTTPVRFFLRGLRLLAKVSRPLEACIGPKQLEQLGLAFLRITRSSWKQLHRVHYEPADYREQVHGAMILLGSHSPWGQDILRAVAPQEQDLVWRGLIRAAGMDWAQTLTVIQEAADRLARIEHISATEGFQHLDLEEQAEASLLISFAPDALPDFLVHLYEGPPELGAMTCFYFYSMRLQGLRELQDGPEKLSGLARLTEACRLAATTSRWKPEEFNRLAWLCHTERLLCLHQSFQDTSLEDGATLLRAGHAIIAAMEEAPRMPPPDSLADAWAGLLNLRERVKGICELVEAAVRGEPERVE